MAEGNGLSIEQKINQILWGRSIVEVLNSVGQLIPLVLRSLTSGEVVRLDYLYNKEFRNALDSGLLPEEELKQHYIEQGMWTEQDDILLLGFERKVKLLKKQIREAQFLQSRKKKAQRDLLRAETEFRQKSSLRDTLMTLSAENKAEELRRRYMLFSCTETLLGEPYWKSEDIFLNENDNILIYNLVFSYYKQNVFTQAETREIARSGQWRFRWNAAKKGADLFGRPVPEWSHMQESLVYWSQYYDFVYESMERPNDFVIADDNACDAWYEEQIKKLSTKGDEKSNIVGSKKAKTNKFHQEQFVFVEPGDTSTIKQIQEMNAPSVRVQLQKERQKLESSKKRVSEWELRKRDYLVGGMKGFVNFVPSKDAGKGKNPKK